MRRLNSASVQHRERKRQIGNTRGRVLTQWDWHSRREVNFPREKSRTLVSVRTTKGRYRRRVVRVRVYLTHSSTRQQQGEEQTAERGNCALTQVTPVSRQKMAGKTLGGACLAATAVFFIMASTLWDYSHALEHGEACTNPDRVRGTCIGIRSCPPLLSALQAKPLPQSTLDFLRRSQCGFQGRDPLVCCPSGSPPPGSTATPPANTDGGEETEDVSNHPNLGLLRMDICGPVSEDRIINGQEANLMELPWMTLLAYTVRSGSPFKCGGSVINDRYVLTAAHCVTRLQSNLRLVSVRLGEHNLSAPIDCQVDEESEDQVCAPSPQDIPVESVIPHPRYVGKPNLQYDVALVRLSRPVDFRHDAVRPICLPVQLSQQAQNLVGKKVVVSGWGATEKLQPSPVLLKVSVPVMPYPQCSEAFRGVVPISAVSQICAGGVRDGGDSCSGDSGGPLTYFGEIQRSTRTIQHGIVSYGPKNCGSPGQPGVYTRVGHYMKWILDNIKS